MSGLGSDPAVLEREQRNPALFQPFTLRGTTFRNRLWVAPMTLFLSEERDGMPSEFHRVHCGGLAIGGAGAIVVESTAVSKEGRATPHDVGLWNDRQRDAWVPIVAFAREQGARMGIQLGHGGRKASITRSWDPRAGTLPVSDGGWQTVAPSQVAYPGYAPPHELTSRGIADLVDAFVSAAVRARDAGFDFVELHAAHGFLIHQFLSPLANQRTDDYGGPFENRVRFLLEIVAGIRRAVGESMPIVVRVSATDWMPGGWTEQDTARAAGLAAAAGADLFDVSTGGMVPDAAIPVFPGYQVEHAARLRQNAGVPTGAVGLILSSRAADEIVARGQADVVFVGREFLRDPHFALRAAAELGAHIDYHPRPYHRAGYRIDAVVA